MCLAQDNDVVHTLTPDRSDHPFNEAILPGRGRCGRPVPDARRAQSACDDGAIDPIPISDEIVWSFIPRKSLRYLTGNPLEVDNDESIKQVEANGRYNEQIHGGNVWCVVAHEGVPSLVWKPASLNMYLATLTARLQTRG